MPVLVKIQLRFCWDDASKWYLVIEIARRHWSRTATRASAAIIVTHLIPAAATVATTTATIATIKHGKL